MSIPDDFRTGPDTGKPDTNETATRRARRRNRLRDLAVTIPLFLAGIAFSLWLLGRPSLAAAAIWLAVILAITAFVALHRESSR